MKNQIAFLPIVKNEEEELCSTPTRYSSSLPNAYLLPPTPLATSFEGDVEAESESDISTCSIESKGPKVEMPQANRTMKSNLFQLPVKRLEDFAVDKNKSNAPKTKKDKLASGSQTTPASSTTKFQILSPSSRNFVLINEERDCTVYRWCLPFDRQTLSFVGEYNDKIMHPVLSKEDFETTFNLLNSIDLLQSMRIQAKRLSVYKKMYICTCACLIGCILLPLLASTSTKVHKAFKQLGPEIELQIQKINSTFEAGKKSVVLKRVSNGDIAFCMRKYRLNSIARQ